MCSLFIYSLSFVLYMAVRVMNENVTQEEIAQEIGSDPMMAHAIEMAEGDTKGSYKNVFAQEVV